MKRIVLVLFGMLVIVALLAPMAQAQEGPPRGEDVAGKYSCEGPTVVDEDGQASNQVFSPLSKKEAEEGLATGAYVSCQKNLPYQAIQGPF